MRPNRLYRATLKLILLLSLAATAAAQARQIRSHPAVNSERGFSSSHSSPAPVSRQNPDAPRSASVPRGSDGGRSGQAGGRYSGRPHHNRYYGYGYSYPYGYDSYPYGYIPSSFSYAGFPSDDQGEQAAAGAPPEDPGPPPYGSKDELEGQVRQLSDEVAQLLADKGYPCDPGYGPCYDVPEPAPAASEPAPAAPEPQLAAVLVYRDGHQIEIQNYAIYGQTVWVLGDQITSKVAVADLDVARTKQVNGQRGIEFNIPESP